MGTKVHSSSRLETNQISNRRMIQSSSNIGSDSQGPKPLYEPIPLSLEEIKNVGQETWSPTERAILVRRFKTVCFVGTCSLLLLTTSLIANVKPYTIEIK